jgi:hypothetical protein
MRQMMTSVVASLNVTEWGTPVGAMAVSVVLAWIVMVSPGVPAVTVARPVHEMSTADGSVEDHKTC